MKSAGTVCASALTFLACAGGAHADDAASAPNMWEEPIYLQIVNPADTVREHAGKPQPTSQPSQVAMPTAAPRLRSFEMEPVTVYGQGELHEEERIGSYSQPRWTAERRFPGTRIYVQPEGVVQAEFWLRPTSPRHGATQIRALAELEIGLPYRLQLDLYARHESAGAGPSETGYSIEMRYALADWNQIWGNPTFYVEWSRLEDEPDAIEVKLLLGGEIAPRWHWGLNLSDELTTGGTRENEIEITGGVSYAVIDSKFSVGAETEDGVVDTHGHRGRFADKFFFVGPSFQYLPYPQVHIDFAPLVGISHDAPSFRAYLVIGYEF